MVFSYSYVNTNPSWSSSLSCQSFFLTGVSLLKWIRSRQHLQDHLSLLLNGVCFIRLQVAFVFPTLPPFCFSSRTKISSSSIHFIDGKFLHSFPSMFLPGGSQEDVLLVRHSSFLSLLRWIQVKFCWSYLFPHFNVFSYRCTSLSFYFSLFVIPECSRYLEDSCFHSAFVQALSRLVSHSSHLIQPVQHLF